MQATITIEIDHQPAQWRLSPTLAGALGLSGLRSLPYVMQARGFFMHTGKGVGVGGGHHCKGERHEDTSCTRFGVHRQLPH